MTNCPNCGAVIVSNQCEYCGTMFSRDSSSRSLATYQRLNSKRLMLESTRAIHTLYAEAINAMRSNAMLLERLE